VPETAEELLELRFFQDLHPEVGAVICTKLSSNGSCKNLHFHHFTGQTCPE
jgi:hypothetical protein